MTNLFAIRQAPLVAGLMLASLAAPALAQSPDPSAADPNPGRLTLTSTFDGVSTYMFRGIRQQATGVALWPAADLGMALYSGDGGLKSVGLNLGTWNSLHNGDTGTDGPTGELWYESDFYTTLGFGLGGGTTIGTTYTAYTSPNSSYTTVKEIAFKLAVDDSAHLGKGAVKPYALVAFEFDTAMNTGQADGGARRGTYIELGAGPGYIGSKASIAVPVKVGLSGSNYYELCTAGCGTPDAVYTDHAFGFFSVAGVVTVPLGGTTGFGAWNVHGGVEYQALGDTTRALNGDDRSRVIGSLGVGFSY